MYTTVNQATKQSTPIPPPFFSFIRLGGFFSYRNCEHAICTDAHTAIYMYGKRNEWLMGCVMIDGWMDGDALSWHVCICFVVAKNNRQQNGNRDASVMKIVLGWIL